MDVFLEIEKATVLCQDHPAHCQLCVSYGEKIPVKKITKIPGVGNSANVAVGSSRLGLKSALYTVLGRDESGKESYWRLKKEGVALDYIQFDKQRGTNYSTVLNYKGERTIFVFHEPRQYSLPSLAKTKWIYFSSVASGHEKLQQEICELVKKNNIKVGFNPGTFQLREGLEFMKPLMRLTKVFIVNKEEAQTLLGNINDFKKLLELLKQEGPEIAVITDGPKGSYAFDGTDFYFQNIFEVPVVERTGCGDSYSTGFISSLIHNGSVPQAMRWGTINAAFVLQKIGAQEGLLTKKELLKILQDNPKFTPLEI